MIKFLAVSSTAVLALALSTDGQLSSQPKSGLQPMRSAVDLIKKQAPLTVNQSLLTKVTPDDLHIIVSLPKQRAYLLAGEQIIVDSPISPPISKFWMVPELFSIPLPMTASSPNRSRSDRSVPDQPDFGSSASAIWSTDYAEPH